MEINKLLILLLFLNVNSCKCDFSGKTTFVKWEKSKSTFVDTNIELGTLKHSLNIEYCEKRNNNLKIIATVFSQMKMQNELKFYIIGNNTKTSKLDTVSTFTEFKNEFSFDLKEYNYFVFKEENNEIGTKYLIE